MAGLASPTGRGRSRLRVRSRNPNGPLLRQQEAGIHLRHLDVPEADDSFIRMVFGDNPPDRVNFKAVTMKTTRPYRSLLPIRVEEQLKVRVLMEGVAVAWSPMGGRPLRLTAALTRNGTEYGVYCRIAGDLWSPWMVIPATSSAGWKWPNVRDEFMIHAENPVAALKGA